MQLDIKFNITPNALKEIQRIMSESEEIKNAYLRVSIQGGGCSGFMYGLGFEETVDPNQDLVENYGSVKTVIDKKSAIFLHGVTLDWVDDINSRGFKFINPNATFSIIFWNN